MAVTHEQSPHRADPSQITGKELRQMQETAYGIPEEQLQELPPPPITSDATKSMSRRRFLQTAGVGTVVLAGYVTGKLNKTYDLKHQTSFPSPERDNATDSFPDATKTPTPPSLAEIESTPEISFPFKVAIDGWRIIVSREELETFFQNVSKEETDVEEIVISLSHSPLSENEEFPVEQIEDPKLYITKDGVSAPNVHTQIVEDPRTKKNQLLYILHTAPISEPSLAISQRTHSSEDITMNQILLKIPDAKEDSASNYSLKVLSETELTEGATISDLYHHTQVLNQLLPENNRYFRVIIPDTTYSDIYIPRFAIADENRVLTIPSHIVNARSERTTVEHPALLKMTHDTIVTLCQVSDGYYGHKIQSKLHSLQEYCNKHELRSYNLEPYVQEILDSVDIKNTTIYGLEESIFNIETYESTTQSNIRDAITILTGIIPAVMHRPYEFEDQYNTLAPGQRDIVDTFLRYAAGVLTSANAEINTIENLSSLNSGLKNAFAKRDITDIPSL